MPVFRHAQHGGKQAAGNAHQPVLADFRAAAEKELAEQQAPADHGAPVRRPGRVRALDIQDALQAADKVRSFDQLERGLLRLRMRQEGRQYVLIGYGRWGSSIPTLGVPVVWSDISEVRVLVEASLPDFRVDPSQGTHFFQNLTSFNAGYVNVDPYTRREDCLDLSALDALPAAEETVYLRHVQLDKPLTVCVDGRTGRAVIKL